MCATIPSSDLLKCFLKWVVASAGLELLDSNDLPGLPDALKKLREQAGSITCLSIFIVLELPGRGNLSRKMAQIRLASGQSVRSHLDDWRGRVQPTTANTIPG